MAHSFTGPLVNRAWAAAPVPREPQPTSATLIVSSPAAEATAEPAATAATAAGIDSCAWRCGWHLQDSPADPFERGGERSGRRRGEFARDESGSRGDSRTAGPSRHFDAATWPIPLCARPSSPAAAVFPAGTLV